MCDFKPGDEVVCVDNAPGLLNGHAAVTVSVGQVYVVAKVAPSPPGASAWGLSPTVIRLVNAGFVAQTGRPGWYDARRFRKVQRRDLTAWLATENTIEGPVRQRERA